MEIVQVFKKNKNKTKKHVLENDWKGISPLTKSGCQFVGNFQIDPYSLFWKKVDIHTNKTSLKNKWSTTY